MNILKDRTIEQLEQLRETTLRELQALDAEFTMSRAESISSKKEREWRAQAVEDKRVICDSLRMIKAELKIRNNQDGVNQSLSIGLKQISEKLDKIILLMEQKK